MQRFLKRRRPAAHDFGPPGQREGIDFVRIGRPASDLATAIRLITDILPSRSMASPGSARPEIACYPASDEAGIFLHWRWPRANVEVTVEEDFDRDVYVIADSLLRDGALVSWSKQPGDPELPGLLRQLNDIILTRTQPGQPGEGEVT